METKKESKLNYLKEKCKSTKNHTVQLSATYIKETNKYMYYMVIHQTDNLLADLYKHDTDYKYIIKLYNLFMKK